MLKKTVRNLSMVLLLSPFVASGQAYNYAGLTPKLDGQPNYTLPKAAIALQIQVVTVSYEKAQAPEFKDTRDAKEIAYYEARYGLDKKVYAQIRDNGSFTTSSFSDDSLKVTITATPDYTKTFYIDPNVSWNKKLSVSFVYGPNGLLSEAQSSLEDKTFDLIVKGLSGVVSVATAFSLLKAKPAAPAYIIQELEDELTNFDKLKDQSDYSIYKDLKAGYEKKYNLMFGRYFYTAKKTTVKTKIVFIPLKGDETKTIPLFKISDDGKVVANSDLKDRVWGSKLKYDKIEDAKAYKISFTKTGDQPCDAYVERKSNAVGFAFNVPLIAALNIADPKGEIVYQELHKIPQFGIIAHVTSKKGSKITAGLDPVTGELTKLVIEGKDVITPDQVAAGAAALTEAGKAINGDPDAELAKEVTRLENEKKRRDLLKELGIEE